MPQDNSHIRLGMRVKKRKLTPHKWLKVDKIPPDIACIIILPGSNTQTDRQANSYAKETQRLIKNKTIPIYCAAYDKADRDFRQDREAVLARYGQANPRYPYIRHVKEMDKYYIPRYICELYNATFAPRLRNDDNSKAPLALAAQRLNMMPFVNHCNGSTVLLQMEYLLLNDMSELGYTTTQQQYLCRQIHSLNIAPVTPIGITQTTTFKFMTLRDEIALSVNTPITSYLASRYQDDAPPTMDISLFRPTADEIIFAADAMYIADKNNPGVTSLEAEHSYAAYTERNDDNRTIAGDRINMTFNLLLNRLVTHALQNQTTLTELPDITKEKPFDFIFKETLNNRYNFLAAEIKHFRTHTAKDLIPNKKQR